MEPIPDRPAGKDPGGPTAPPRAGGWLGRLLAPLDWAGDRVFSSRWNPFHQTGNLAVFCLLVSTITGIYLFLFYRIAAPYESVQRIEHEIFLGSWVRSLHRLSADLALVATVLHLLRKLAAGHTYGPRVRAWTSGVVLLGVLLFCGWTGLVMVWDSQALSIAREGARLIDLVPILSQPLVLLFSGTTAVPPAFFFMNLFLHVALPLGMTFLVWWHVSRLARPAWWPARPVWVFCLLALGFAALLVPAGIGARADLLAVPGSIPVDLFYAFWLPVAWRLSPLAHLVLWAGGALGLLSLAWFWKPARPIRVSWVDPDRCTGCESCVQDCPYEALAMVPRTAGRARSAWVAQVDPSRCVGCGICAAACAPMGVGPPGATGRDQLAAIRRLIERHRPAGQEVLVLGCAQSAVGAGFALFSGEGLVVEVPCAGNVHTAAVELALRSGFGGVMLVSCPPRDCRFREGPKWLRARLEEGREAELPERVDRRRIAFVECSRSEVRRARRAFEELRRRVEALDLPGRNEELVEELCRRAEELEPLSEARRG